jgi:histidinol dehydrogenase
MASRSKGGSVVTVLEHGDGGFARAFDKLCHRQQARDESVDKIVRKIVEGVRDHGDAEVFALTKRLDGASLEELEVDRDEWDAAVAEVPAADRAALGKAAMRVREFHKKRIPASWEMREEGGAFMGHRVRPLARVGIYVPGGKASYPSTVIMNAVPASVVEVPEIVMATPPERDGSIRPAVLMAARVAGVHRVFKMGGAQAIAALAFGTASVPRVDKIVGPGNAYVQHAKRLVFGEVGIDSEAGPTEVLVVADKSATPAWVAADLLSQAEHEEDASALLITHVRPLAARVKEQLAKQLEAMPRAKIARESMRKHGVIVVSKDLEHSFELANRYAPEHMVIASDAAETLLKKVANAGTVFLGHYTPVAVGDYLAGPNHVLPTGGTARFFSPLGVDDFLKRTAFVRFEPPKLRELGSDVIRLAALEGFDGHGQSVELRLAKIRRARREREAAREAESGDGAEWDL